MELVAICGDVAYFKSFCFAIQTRHFQGSWEQVRHYGFLCLMFHEVLYHVREHFKMAPSKGALNKVKKKAKSKSIKQRIRSIQRLLNKVRKF